MWLLKLSALALLAALSLIAAPARAESLPVCATPECANADTGAGQLMREALDRLLRVLELTLQDIPQYGAPRLTERGDIVVPRLNPAPRRRVPSNPDEART